MGQIVAAMATVHAPQLFTYPPTEDPAQLDADIAAMRQLGKDLEEIKPDAVIVIGADLRDRRRREIESRVRAQDLCASDSSLRRGIARQAGEWRFRYDLLAGCR